LKTDIIPSNNMIYEAILNYLVDKIPNTYIGKYPEAGPAFGNMLIAKGINKLDEHLFWHHIPSNAFYVRRQFNRGAYEKPITPVDLADPEFLYKIEMQIKEFLTQCYTKLS